VDLIERRDLPWVEHYATRAVVALDELAAGTAPEFQDVVAGYKDFYTRLLRAGGERGGLFARNASGAALRGMLDQADRALAALEDAVTARGAYLDEAAAGLSEGSGAPGDPALRRQRLDFLEQVEERFGP
jgi:hypothetical protein